MCEYNIFDKHHKGKIRIQLVGFLVYINQSIYSVHPSVCSYKYCAAPTYIERRGKAEFALWKSVPIGT